MNMPPETDSTLSDSEVVRYEAAWQQFRVASARYWLMFLGYIPAVLFFGWLLSFAFNENLAHGIVAISWMVLWGVMGRGYLQFRCPRCGKKFFARDHFSTNLTSKCLNCGLPKYSSDRV